MVDYLSEKKDENEGEGDNNNNCCNFNLIKSVKKDQLIVLYYLWYPADVHSFFDVSCIHP